MSFSKKQDPRVEQLISEALAGIRSALAASQESSSVRAVVLGGGYGRGEGGATPEGMPYNDLDFFVIMKGSPASPALRRLLDRIGSDWGAKLAIDVDFYCVNSIQALCRDAHTLMIQELFAGSTIVFGDERVFDGVPLRPFSEIPWTEGARLLLNRGAGLLFARQRTGDPAQADFVRRNLHKAALGCGDAVLVVHHDYRRTGTERLEALRAYPEVSWLVPAYQAALEFKYTPPDRARTPGRFPAGLLAPHRHCRRRRDFRQDRLPGRPLCRRRHRPQRAALPQIHAAFPAFPPAMVRAALPAGRTPQGQAPATSDGLPAGSDPSRRRLLQTLVPLQLIVPLTYDAFGVILQTNVFLKGCRISFPHAEPG